MAERRTRNAQVPGSIPGSGLKFVALIAVFRAKSGTSALLDHFGIYTDDLSSYLVS